MIKRLSAIALVLCMVLCVFAGCSGTTTTTTSEIIIEGGDSAGNDGTASGAEDTASGDSASGGDAAGDSGEVVQKPIKNPLNVDLKGATITIYSPSEIFDATRKAATKNEQQHIAMLKSLQKKINCKIVSKKITAAQLQTNLFTTLSSGKSFSNLVMTNIHGTGPLVANKLVTSLKQVPGMDLTADYINVAESVEAATYGGGTWFIAEPYSVNNGAWGVFFNKRILEEIGSSDAELYKLVKNKKWTLAKMRELSDKAVKDLDGKAGMTIDDRWGLVCFDAAAAFPPSVFSAYGVQMVKTDANGGLKYNTDAPDVINAINYACETLKAPSTCTPVGEDKDVIKLFTSGNSLFFYLMGSAVTELSDMDDDFGFLPFPAAKDGGAYKSAPNWNHSAVLIPKGLKADELKNTGSFLQAYAYMCQDVNKKAVDDYAARYFRDDESADNFELAAKGQKLEVIQGIAPNNEPILSGTYRIFWDNLNATQTPIASHIQETKSAAVKALGDLTAKLK